MSLREMIIDDLDQDLEIEEELFSVPWTREGFFTFLTRDDSMFLVVEEKEKTTKEEQVYYEWQTVEEILELCEKGLDLEEFFK